MNAPLLARKVTPLKIQFVGADFLASRERAGLFDEPGVGKTGQGIMAMDKAGIRRGLIICNAAARAVWVGEFKKWATYPRKVIKARTIDDVNLWIRGKVDVLILSYEHATKWAKALAGDLIPLIIFDEAHYLKTPESQRTRAMLGAQCDGREGLASWAIQAWFLTGTDMPNDPVDGWPFLRFAGATKLTRAAFVKRYFHQRPGTYGVRYTPRKEMVEELALARKAVSLKRTEKDAEIYRPPLTITPQTIDGNTAEILNLLAEWPGLEKAIVQAVDAGGLSFLDAQHIATLRRLVAEAKAPAYLEYIVEEMRAARGEKLVIMGIHKQALQTIHDGLNRAGLKTVMMTGSTPETQRGPLVKQFQEDPKTACFVGNIKAAGTAITLTAARWLDMFESSWAPADNFQAIKRVHRHGQTRKVRARMWGLANSIDERVTDVVAQKTAAIAMIEQR